MFAHGFEQDPAPGVPGKLHEEASDLSLDRAQRQLDRDRALTKKLDRLSAEYRTELRALVGGDAPYARIAELRAQLHRKVVDASRTAPATLAGEQVVRDAKREAVAKSKRLLEELGLDEVRAKELRRSFSRRRAEAIGQARDLGEGRPFVVRPEEVPESVHNPWAIFEPPYPGAAWSYEWRRSDEPQNPSVGRFLDRLAGGLGSFSTLYVEGADDSDYSWSRYNTGMRFWYQMPAAGMAEAWLEMQCVTSSYCGIFIDEAGRSEADSQQSTDGYLHVILPSGGSRRSVGIADYSHEGRDLSWVHGAYEPGERRWAHIFSADTYPADTWLLLEVGTEDWNDFWCNDVTVGSYLTVEWFLRRVYVHSTGE